MRASDGWIRNDFFWRIDSWHVAGIGLGATGYDFWRSFDGLRISGDVHCPDATAIIACRFTPMATATQHCCLLLLEEVTCS